MNILGLKKGVVKLVSHNSKWALLYEKEKQILSENLKGKFITIEHAGSTAIKGIFAKPIIDIWIGTKTTKDFKKTLKGLKNSGYEQIRTTKSPLVHYVFAKGSVVLGTTHYLHLVKHNGKIWKDTIAFRDILRSNNKLAKEYEKLKMQLSKNNPTNRINYIKGKTKFILSVLKNKK